MLIAAAQDEFEGQILHSTQHDKATDHAGKRVAVVGACTSTHDITADYADNGVDVTLVQCTSIYIMTNKEGMPRLMKGASAVSSDKCVAPRHLGRCVR